MRNVSNTVKDYLEAGRVELALSAASLIVLGLTYIDMLPSTGKIFLMLASVFFVTLGVYAFNNVTDSNEDTVNKPNSVITSGRKSVREILIFSLTCKLVAIVSAFIISWAVFIVISIIIIGSFLYSYKPKKETESGRLKDIFIIKNLTVALLWSLVPLLPMLAYGFSIPSSYLLIIFFVIISGFISSIISDLKDVEGDKAAGIKTFPSVHGVNKTLVFLTAINSLGLFAIVTGWFFINLKLYLLLLPIISITRYYSFWLIYTKKKSSAFVYKKMDMITETAYGPLAFIGRLLIH